MAKEYAIKFYSSNSWIKCRLGFMQSKNFVCDRCNGVGYIAHHKKHITPENINDPNITLNWANLQCLCLECHNAVHGNSEAFVNGVSFDNDGNIILDTPQT